ncbi:basement membrane-specific heparan sulfate proteoglycan core protein isoform X2 [Procambarus clarkii]|uniref:basement membrane-specific heparan sulfate proteoglycan core protein isoform X2 n=1 Tax=Procambarus clarkii TaxID=6728 RepID=UPI003743B688
MMSVYQRLALSFSCLLLLRASGALEVVSTSAGSGIMSTSDTGQVPIEGFMEEIRQAMTSQWEILQNIRYHTLVTKVRVTQLEAQVKNLAAKNVSVSEPVLHTFGSDTTKPGFYSTMGETKPCEGAGPDADGGVSLLVEAMKELSANYNRLLNSSVLSSNGAITFEEDFDKLAEIANRIKDLSGDTATAPSPGNGEIDVGVTAIASGVKIETRPASGVEDVRRPTEAAAAAAAGPSIAVSSSPNVTVRVGDTATLTCHVNNLGDTSVSWVRSEDGSFVAIGSYVFFPSSRFQVVAQVGSKDHHLRILQVKEEDQGAYECQVSGEPLIIHTIWLTVKGMDDEEEEADTESPSIVSSPNVTVQVGETATLTCRVHHLGDQAVTWIRTSDEHILAIGEVNFSRDSRLQVTHDRQSGDWLLRIEDVAEGDEGPYVCTASSAVPASVTIWLNVETGVEEAEGVSPSIVETSNPNVTATAGETATLSCPASNLGDAAVFWYRDKDLNLLTGGPVTYAIDDRFKAMKDEGADDWTLQITRLRVSDAGWYECVVVYPSPVKHRVYLTVEESSTTTSREARLLTEDPTRIGPRILPSIGPRILPIMETRILTEASSSNVTVLEGDSTSLTCRVQNLGTNTVTWSRRKDLHILTAGQYTFTPDDRFSAFHEGEDWRLQISTVNKSDEGEYECLVSTSSPITRIFFLKVVELQAAARKPMVVDSNEDVTVFKGETATLSCPFPDHNTHTTTWVRIADMRVLEGPVITSDEHFTLQQDQGGYSSLKILAVTELDEGVYQCKVSTNPPNTRLFHLSVQDPLWPIMEEVPTDVHTVAGKTVTLTCRVSSQIQPIITWKKNGLQLTYGRHQVTRDGDLLIRDVRFSDEGRYLCNATNRHGSVESGANLRVEMATKIIKAPKDRHRMKGESAVFRCKAVADSDLVLSVEWLVNGEVVDYDKNPRLMRRPKNALMVSPVTEEDAGVYTCLASTSLDSVTANATLTVKGSERHSKVPTGSRVLTPSEEDPCPLPYQMLKDDNTLCVLLVTDRKLSWREASQYCRDGGGELAWEAENVLLRIFLDELHGLAAKSWTQWPFWVGGRENKENISDTVPKGGGVSNTGTRNKGGGTGGKGGGSSSSSSSVWRWVDGTRVPSTDVWARGQPRQYGRVMAPDGVCMVLDGYFGYRASALPCHLRRRFLCRRIVQ